MTAYDPIQFWATAQPDRVAVRSAHSTWTYAQLDAAVWSAADALYGRGLGSGEHLSLEFDPEDAVHFAVTLHALHRIGLLPVLVGTTATPEERQALRERAQVEFTLSADDLVLGPPGDAPGKAGKAKKARAAKRERAGRSKGLAEGFVASATGGAPGAEATGGEGEAAEGPAPLLDADGEPILTRRLDAPAAILFTSGTSGMPRAVVLTHGNLLWSAIASARNLGVREGDVWLCPMPPHHVGGLSVLTRSAYYGTTALLHERFDPDRVNEAIDKDGVTLVSLVPTMLTRLLATRRGRPFPPGLRAALIGGGPMPRETLEEAAALGLRALPTYGLTEAASQVTTLPLGEWPRGLDTAGRPLPFTRVEIRDDDGRRVAPGAEGEILVRGPTVMAGYLGDPEATLEALEGRWLHTGDVGAWDGQGRLRVLDRRVDRIVTGGENVSPLEVERAILSHPAVRGACVVALPSTEWGQEVAVAVEWKPGSSATLEELRAHASGTLSGFKLPRRLLAMPALPRNATGKLLRRVVRERLLDDMAKQKHP